MESTPPAGHFAKVLLIKDLAMSRKIPSWLPWLLKTAALFCFWLLLSGKFESFYLVTGLLGCTFIAWIHTPAAQPRLPFSRYCILAFGFVCYALWLTGRIFLAAYHVAIVVLSPKLKIQPGFIKHKTLLKSDLEKVIFANSITLTPGTITVDIDGDYLVVHRLDEESSGDIDTEL